MAGITDNDQLDLTGTWTMTVGYTYEELLVVEGRYMPPGPTEIRTRERLKGIDVYGRISKFPDRVTKTNAPPLRDQRGWTIL